MTPEITVIICTHNPRRDYLERVLTALEAQTLPQDQWELLLIDNASNSILSSEIDLTWHLHARHVREETLGLTAARLCGFREAKAAILVFADDDNVLAPDYLKHTLAIFRQHSQLGAIGGKSLPEFEVNPEPWFANVDAPLGIRDLGNQIQICIWTETTQSQKQYPPFAPIGAGLAIRKQAAELYVQRIIGNRTRLALGRTGQQLTSGEDNDIVLTLLEASWGIAYFPELQLTHLISAKRLTKEYLARLNRASTKSWIQVLDIHDIRLWPKVPRWTVLPRQIKAFFCYQPWRDPASYIRWQGACGLFEGQAELL
ncbi:glycosyltransferase [Leptolyngbya sp. NK1-12]|uniref:Glycosyltransferase n=1 Tax=Leptolyngbya sp. NK1-12 TaxID=2547451 RepID=A0AA97ALC3_9CYAN|nr:glycosyltransferase [Leptolyngbya sp. NK1-12]